MIAFGNRDIVENLSLKIWPFYRQPYESLFSQHLQNYASSVPYIRKKMRSNSVNEKSEPSTKKETMWVIKINTGFDLLLLELSTICGTLVINYISPSMSNTSI